MPESSGMETVDIEVFGHKFKNLFPDNAEDLITLEKEGALYVDHYDKSTKKFNHYRVAFLPKEIVEYVEAHVAEQEFDEGLKKFNGDFSKALGNITNKKIAERVQAYKKVKTKDGRTDDLRGSLASFLGPDLEDLCCFHTRPLRYELLPRINTKDKLAIILDIFDSISNNINYLSKRKHNRPPFNIENEYDVQDLLYIIVKSIFSDAKFEEFTSKHAGTTKKIDIVLPSINVVIEVKYVRDKNHANSITDEIKIDIESYHVHPNCETLCVLIYDPEKNLIDPKSIMKDLSGLRVIGSKKFEIKTIVKN